MSAADGIDQQRRISNPISLDMIQFIDVQRCVLRADIWLANRARVPRDPRRATPGICGAIAVHTIDECDTRNPGRERPLGRRWGRIARPEAGSFTSWVPFLR